MLQNLELYIYVYLHAEWGNIMYRVNMLH